MEGGIRGKHKSHKHHNAAAPSMQFPQDRVCAELDPGVSHSYVNHTCSIRPSIGPQQPPPDTSYSSPAQLLIQPRNHCSRWAHCSDPSLRGSASNPSHKTPDLSPQVPHSHRGDAASAVHGSVFTECRMETPVSLSPNQKINKFKINAVAWTTN